MKFHPVTATEIPEVLTFVQQVRAELFPKLSASGLPADLAHFEAVYLRGDGRFLVARVDGLIVATIGYLPYDGRFPQLDYRGRKVVEVVRLFVLPAHRRAGLAAARRAGGAGAAHLPRALNRRTRRALAAARPTRASRVGQARGLPR